MLIKIGELAKRTHCQVGTIRHYEKEGLLPEPARTRGNYRLYNSAQLDRLEFIRHCRSLDMALAEIRILLRFKDAPERNCDEINRLLDKHIEQVIARIHRLSSLKQQLVVLQQTCNGGFQAESCGILKGLSGDV